MNKFINFLVVPIVLLGIMGCASSTQQILYEPYSKNSQIPTIDNLLKYKTINLININNPVVKECCEYLATYDLSNNRLLNRLVLLIYGFSNQITRYCTDVEEFKADYDFNYLDTVIKWSYNEINTEPIYNNILREKNINVNEWQFIEIDTLLKQIQKILDPESKYKKGDTLSDNISQAKAYNIIELLYYISNKFVQISHDLINAVHEKIKENKSLNENEIIKTSMDIRDKIIEPCYNNIGNIIHMMGNSILNIVQNGSIVDESKKLGRHMENMLKFISHNGDNSFKPILQFCKSTACENLSKISREILQQLKNCSEGVKNNQNASITNTSLISKILERIFECIQNQIYKKYIEYSNLYYNIMHSNSIIECYYIDYIENILKIFDQNLRYRNVYNCYENLMYYHNLKPQDRKCFARYYLTNKKYIDTILEPLYKLKTHEFITKTMLDFDYNKEMNEILKNT